MIEERYELAIGRIKEMRDEKVVQPPFREFFQKMAEFVIMLDELKTQIESGAYAQFKLKELEEWNERLYQDILPQQYNTSYAWRRLWTDSEFFVYRTQSCYSICL